MKTIILAAAMLFFAGCGRRTPPLPDQIGGYRLGAVQRPGAGGILQPVSIGTVTLGPYQPALKLHLTPAGHKICRLTLIFTGLEPETAVEKVKKFLTEQYGGEFRTGGGIAICDIPPYRISIRQDLSYGPGGVTAEISHTVLAAESSAELQLPEVQKQLRQEKRNRQKLLIEEALEAFAGDCGAYPLSLSELMVNSAKRQGWNWPYLEQLPETAGYRCRYQLTEKGKYQLKLTPADDIKP